MAFYNRINDFYLLVGNNVGSKTNETIDDFLSSLTNQYSNAGLILNYIKNSGVSGNTTIKTVLSNSQYFNILNQALRLAKITNSTDFYQKVIESRSLYTEENNFILLENDVDSFGYSGGTFAYTTLVESKESAVLKDIVPGDIVGKVYRLVGSVFLDDSNSTGLYILPLGLITIEGGPYVQASLGFSKNSVLAQDTLFDNVVTPLAPGCFVTNSLTGDFDSAPIAFIFADNTLLGPDDYELYLVVAAPGFPISKTGVSIDQDFSIGVTPENFNKVKATFTNITPPVI